MTDKVQKIREEVKMVVNRRLNLLNGDYFNLIKETDGFTNEIMDIIDPLQEEPVSEKKCIFTKDNYTDEERKVLCEDCKEKCEYSKKKELISEDLGEYIDKLSKQFPEVSFAKLSRIAVRVAKWQKEQMILEAIDGVITNAGGTFGYDVASFKFNDNHSFQVFLPTDRKSKYGDKVKILVIKED